MMSQKNQNPGLSRSDLEALEQELAARTKQAPATTPAEQASATAPATAPALAAQSLRYHNALKGSQPADSRRKPLGTKTSWSVTECWDLHAQIKRRLFLGQKNTEIASALGCDKQTVSLVRNSPAVQEALAELHQKADEQLIDVQREIAAKAPRALQVLEELMESGEKDAVRLTAARDLLDRAGHKAAQEITINDGLSELPREMLRALVERLRSAGKLTNAASSTNPSLRRIGYGE